MTREVRHAYSKRALEYVAALGSVKDMHPLDVDLISGWGMSVTGPILDAGSGPGHWTDLLRSFGCDVRGIDIVPDFVKSARKRFPLTVYEVGDLLQIPFDSSIFGGVLAWYSVIHMRHERRELAFKEFARVLRPEGTLLVGAFLGPQDEPFDHAITRSFYLSEAGLTDRLEAIGFEVIATDTRTAEGSRPHLSVLARLPSRRGTMRSKDPGAISG